MIVLNVIYTYIFNNTIYQTEMKLLILKPNKLIANANFQIVACYDLTTHFNFKILHYLLPIEL